MGFVDIILFQISNASKSFGVELHKCLRSSKIIAIAYSKQAYSKSIVVYDLLNELVIDAEMNIYNSSERTCAIKQ
ncbi:MAG: hypothetical protein KKF62_12855 [Bacteroidetes bacterium]|nr:hypothetical protein [Bacteroidota bacterium]